MEATTLCSSVSVEKRIKNTLWCAKEFTSSSDLKYACGKMCSYVILPAVPDA